ncbi:serpentine type 7TM GPCR chemoreceptor srt domain-containing protein [Ditylenchus destructor]|uniref:Serpentine type 7TM GPCR chemoreceptor srt domain-containing protein n=1 Tax=Ditylenchus destructor TaxID=166010 RepID=A0AAD4QZT2_9BILA|nr:serpentine type 7TM GPCR chemoreceptor srt domain-containing protein [Ditylenchus destructor]
MDLLLYDKLKYEEMYNCSKVNLSTVPMEERRHVVVGTVTIIVALIYELLYLPCLLVIARRRSQSSSYKFMLYIGIVDVICLWINGFITGYYAIMGTVYCDYEHPYFMYFVGCSGNALWYMETWMAFILALSRCVDTVSPRIYKALFEGNRAWYWSLIPSVYGFYFGYFRKPVIFTGVYDAWFFNPYAGYIDDSDMTYDSPQHTVHNVFISVSFISLYVIFVGLFILKNIKYKHSGTQSTQQKMAFLQVFIISVVNASCSGIYALFQYIPIGPVLLVVAQFLWISSHGVPGVLYITMNPTVRREVKLMFRRVLHLRQGVSSGISNATGSKVLSERITSSQMRVEPASQTWDCDGHI